MPKFIMYAIFTIIFLLMIPKTIRDYKKTKDKLDFATLIAEFIIVICSIFLLIIDIVDKN